MTARASKKDQQMRLRLAQEAARILLESGSRDFALAKRKAAEHLGAHDTRKLPSNLEVEQALVEYQRLFRSDSQPQHLRKLREIAIEAMQFFTEFNPKLVGPVLNGTADTNSTINLHVFSDTPEAISLFLMENDIPFESHDKKMNLGNEIYDNFSCFSFYADQQKIELTVFPISKRAPIPLSPVDGRPMQRASRNDVVQLLQEELFRPQ